MITPFIINGEESPGSRGQRNGQFPSGLLFLEYKQAKDKSYRDESRRFVGGETQQSLRGARPNRAAYLIVDKNKNGPFEILRDVFMRISGRVGCLIPAVTPELREMITAAVNTAVIWRFLRRQQNPAYSTHL